MTRPLESLTVWLAALATHPAPAADPPKPAAVLVPAGMKAGRPSEPDWLGFSPDGRTLAARYTDRLLPDSRGEDDELVAWAADGWAERWRRPYRRLAQWLSDAPPPPARRGLVVFGAFESTALMPVQSSFPGQAVWAGEAGGPVHLLLAAGPEFRLRRADLAKLGAGSERLAGPNLLTGAAEDGREVRSAALAPDGRWLAVSHGGVYDRCRVELWDVRGGKRAATLAGHAGMVTALAFAPDGKTLATGGSDARVRLWNVPAGTERTVLAGGLFTVSGLTFSADGKRLVIASTGTPIAPNLRMADPTTGKVVGSLSTGRGVRCLALSPDGRLAATAGYGTEVQVWNIGTLN